MSPAIGFGFLQRLARNTVPVATIFLTVLLGQLPFPLPFFADVSPSLALMAIYYWVAFRPDLTPRWAVFSVGLVQDALTGAPFGLYALVFLLVLEIVLNQRRFISGKPFWVFWSGFALVAPMAALAAWMLASLLRGEVMPFDSVLIGLLLTLLAFPPVAWLLVQEQKLLVGVVEDL